MINADRHKHKKIQSYYINEDIWFVILKTYSEASDLNSTTVIAIM